MDMETDDVTNLIESLSDAVAIVNESRIVGSQNKENETWVVNKKFHQLLFDHDAAINFQQIFDKPVFTVCNSLGQDLDSNLTLFRVIQTMINKAEDSICLKV